MVLPSELFSFGSEMCLRLYGVCVGCLRRGKISRQDLLKQHAQRIPHFQSNEKDHFVAFSSRLVERDGRFEGNKGHCGSSILISGNAENMAGLTTNEWVELGKLLQHIDEHLTGSKEGITESIPEFPACGELFERLSARHE